MKATLGLNKGLPAPYEHPEVFKLDPWNYSGAQGSKLGTLEMPGPALELWRWIGRYLASWGETNMFTRYSKVKGPEKGKTPSAVV